MGYFTTRRKLEDELAYLLTEASEEQFYRATHSGRLAEVYRLLGNYRRKVGIPQLDGKWVQPMWGLAAK